MFDQTRQRINQALTVLHSISTIPLAVHPRVIHRLNDNHGSAVFALQAELDAMNVSEAVAVVSFEAWAESRSPSGQTYRAAYSARELQAAQDGFLAAQERLKSRIAQLEQQNFELQNAQPSRAAA